jgi:iron complex transport system ATP-binding protein
MNLLPSTEIITTHDLTVGYGDHVLFRNLDLTVNQGELICFMGPNGAGKSTLIRTLSGLQKPLKGRIDLVDPEARVSITTKTNHLVSVVLTEKVTAGLMTVEELVTFGRYPYLEWNIRLTERDRECIERAIDHVHVSHLRKMPISQLSDGQLQLVMIARALAQDTPVIILDEPTAHLDLNNRLEIMRMLHALTRSLRKAILLATHDLDLALQTADRIWLTGNNQDIIDGIPEDLVLNGTFDSIFQFKGFDLRTGKVKHVAHRDAGINLTGEGYAYLWTKNALERNGFRVNEGVATINVKVAEGDNQIHWLVGDDKKFNSIVALLEHIIPKMK